jgi:hypothetical protein
MSLCSSKFSFPDPSSHFLNFNFNFKTFSYVTDNNISDTEINSPQANVGAQILVSFIQDTRSMLKGMGLGSIPVGNSDAGSYFNNEVLAVCDFGVRPCLSTSHPLLFFTTHFFFFFWLTQLFTCA